MEEKIYKLGDTIADYLISEEGRVSLLLLPEGSKEQAKNWELGPSVWDARSEYIRDWRQGFLVHLHLRQHGRSRGNGVTMKFSPSTQKLAFTKQWTEEQDGVLLIRTQLDAKEGYRVVHTLGYDKVWNGIFSEAEFENTSENEQVLEMLSSFALDNLSPYQRDNDQTDKLKLHRFLGSWALEGRHKVDKMEELGLQRAWATPFIKSERFGSIGSWTTQKYFPTAVVEDSENGIFWGASLECNTSWQMEVTKEADTISFTGGLADEETGAWFKKVAPGEKFLSPRARLAVVACEKQVCLGEETAGYQRCCHKLLNLQRKAAAVYGEEGMPITFNEYCSSWGFPTEEKELQYAKTLQGRGFKYLVIDAGWSKGSKEQWGNGEWLVDEEKFPHMLEMNRQLRTMGIVPGVWFEFENTTDGSKVFGPDYDDMHLKRDGVVIRFGEDRSFWDFRNEKTRSYLREHVIEFLRKYEFGYMKVDYNGNIGLGCDGAESLGEGLRRQMNAVREFFEEIKRELPDLIVENCASGAHRMEATMMSVTAMTSFSDAHEAKEIPYIAANQTCLCLPKQNLIWAVLREDDPVDRLIYSTAAGFLGRQCFSGDIERLSEEQWKTVDEGISLYQKTAHIIEKSEPYVYRSDDCNTRHPKGMQVVAFGANPETQEADWEIVLVYHGFYESSQASEEEKTFVKILIPNGYSVNDKYGAVDYVLGEGFITIYYAGQWSAGVLYLKKDE